MSVRSVRAAAITTIEDKIRRAKELQKVLDDFYEWLESCPPLPEAVHAELVATAPGRDAKAEDDDPTSLLSLSRTDAVVAVLKGNPSPLTIAEIHDALTDCGYPIERRAAGNAVYRVARQGRIHKHGSHMGNHRWGASMPPESETPRDDLGPYQGMSQKEAVQAFLKGTPGSHKPSDIAKALIDGGMQTAAQNFATSVSAILAGLEKRNEAWRDKKGFWHASVEVRAGVERLSVETADLLSL